MSNDRYTHQRYETTPSPAAALAQVAQGQQDARAGLPLDTNRSYAYIDGWAIEASAINVREYGERMSKLAAMFRTNNLV